MKRYGTIRSWLIVGLVCAGFTLAAAGGGDLNTRKVRVELRDVTVQKALKDLIEGAGCRAVFEASAGALLSKKATLVTAEEVPVKTALALVTAYVGLQFSVKGDNVVIFRSVDIEPAKAKGEEAGQVEDSEWIARSYDVRELVTPLRDARSPFRRQRIGTYYKTGGHPTWTDRFWNDYGVALSYGEVLNFENLYHGLNEEEYERAVLLSKARSLVFNIMNTINPGAWAPPIIFEEVTEVVAPELAGIPPQQAVEQAIAAGKSGIIIYRDGVLTILVKKGTPLRTTYLGRENEERLTADGGIGVGVTVSPKGYLIIGNVEKGQPADLAGLKKGDIIVGVNGKSIQGMTLNMAASEIRGPIGTKATIQIVRMDPVEKKTFEVLRAPVTK